MLFGLRLKSETQNEIDFEKELLHSESLFEHLSDIESITVLRKQQNDTCCEYQLLIMEMKKRKYIENKGEMLKLQKIMLNLL
jgi:hypothetical protein